MCEDDIGLETIRRSPHLAFFDPEMSALASALDRYYAVGPAGDGSARIAPRPERNLPETDTPLTGSAANPEAGPVRVVVERVLDGDTIFVGYPDGSTATLRLRDIDAPEIHSANEAYRFTGVTSARCLDQWGEIAARHALEALDGQSVDLVSGPTVVTSTFDQPLAYVRLDGEDFNSEMVALGYARAFVGQGNGPRVERYLQLEERARARGIGLWEC